MPLDAGSLLLTASWADECLWHQCSTRRISENSEENLGGLEGVKAIVDDILIWGDDDSFEEATASHDKKLLTLLKRCQRKNVKLNKEKFQLKKTVNCSTCIWVWPNRQRIYTWPQETRLYCVHTCPNQQRWIEKTTWWCYLPLTFYRRFFNQVRTTESSAEEQQCLYLGIK